MPTLRPWREIATPHPDVLRGTFQQAEFAAHLYRVHDGTASPEYGDPVKFFGLTFITEGMRLLLRNVVQRLTGHGGDPVIQLQTAFGGGKTHTMLAVYHLVRRADGKVAAGDLPGISAILNELGVTDLPHARVVVLDAGHLSVDTPAVRAGQSINTLWGELAWQLGGQSAYELVRRADESGTAPGSEVLIQLLKQSAPCVILMDELVVYMRQFRPNQHFSGGDYNSNLSFVQNLTEAIKAVPTAQLLASLPESDREAGDDRAVAALHALEHAFNRIQALWKPVATDEAFEIVRRRLFTPIADEAAADAICRAYATYYIEHPGEFPAETQQSSYYQRLRQAYPIHPEVFSRLYEDWATLDNFQRTRGVLKLMAQVISQLWADNNQDPFIQPGNLPLANGKVRGDFVLYLPNGWDAVVERDIDGPLSGPQDIDSRDPRFGAVQAGHRVARTIFLGSAPNTAGNQTTRGLTPEHIMLGSAIPGQTPAVYTDALKRLADRLHHLTTGNNRYWFDTRPNLRREMEERKRRFDELADVLPELKRIVQKAFGRPEPFASVHVFAPSVDVADDEHLRLVVLPPKAACSRSTLGPATDVATEFLEKRGENPRIRRNRLVFLAPELETNSRLFDQLRSVLAWESIVVDCKESRINLDRLQEQQVVRSRDEARKALDRLVREAYRWLIVPSQDARPGSSPGPVRWEALQLPTSSVNGLTVEIERLLVDNEMLLSSWAPVHLVRQLQSWFWKPEEAAVTGRKVWEDFSRYLYLPRLRNSQVLLHAANDGVKAGMVGAAHAQEGAEYKGFVFEEGVGLGIDHLLIEPGVAKAYVETRRAAAAGEGGSTSSTGGGDDNAEPGSSTGSTGSGAGAETGEGLGSTAGGSKKVPVRRYIASVELDNEDANSRFTKIMAEIVRKFTLNPSHKIRLTLDIEVESPTPFDDDLQRTVRENSTTLKINNHSFEQ
ncbi:ATP-binding protein [Hymenobacter daeguensis]